MNVDANRGLPTISGETTFRTGRERRFPYIFYDTISISSDGPRTRISLCGLVREVSCSSISQGNWLFTEENDFHFAQTTKCSFNTCY